MRKKTEKIGNLLLHSDCNNRFFWNRLIIIFKRRSAFCKRRRSDFYEDSRYSSSIVAYNFIVL